MVEWKISNEDIESTERLLLPDGGHFSEDARNVIRCWHSTDIAACPGSGKTTVLLAKLKLLADRMPLVNNTGVCVLSHTNVAVNEIKNRLSDYADKLLSYPNYIGTIQSFVDKFVTMPYLRNVKGRSVQAVDDFTYAQHMLNRMQNNKEYSTLKYLVNKNCEKSSVFKEPVEYVQALCLRADGSLCINRQKRVLAGSNRPSSIEYNSLIDDLLRNEGIIKYRDAYCYATEAIKNLSETYTALFSSRFRYVFVDEYQDCDEVQREAIDAIFNASNCVVIKIGDSDQAIYNSSEAHILDWEPNDGFLPIMTSCRYSQEIANAICKLRKGKDSIATLTGNTGVKPVLLVFSPDMIDKVLDGFIDMLEKYGLYDNKGIYKAIGAVRNKNTSGLKIGSYWSGFDGSIKRNSEYNYCTLVNDIIVNLLEGKLYKAERNIRKLLCRIFHYAKVRHPISGKDFSINTMKKILDDRYGDIYHQWILELSVLQDINMGVIDHLIREKTNELYNIMTSQKGDVFEHLPEHFLAQVTVRGQIYNDEQNIFIDPIRRRRIEFNTIHGVKGETHDATLYLETDRERASDLSRILPYYGVGTIGKSNLFDYSRKLAYVGMSRPSKLLCVAMQDKTYQKSAGVFDEQWEIIDLRE